MNWKSIHNQVALITGIIWKYIHQELISDQVYLFFIIVR